VRKSGGESKTWRQAAAARRRRSAGTLACEVAIGAHGRDTGDVMAIHRTTIDRLPDAERQEVAAILQEFAQQRQQFTSRFCSDEGDSLAFHLLLGLAALGGLIAGVVEQVPADIARDFRAGAVDGILWSLRRPTVLGFAAAAFVLPWTIAVFLRVHRRCGWAVTSFAVMRVYGRRIRLLRFADIASAERRKVGTRRPFSVLEMTATNGKRLTTYATPLMPAILARVPGSTDRS